MKMPQRGHVVQLDTDTHQSVQELLPWYVTGRLDAVEAARIEGHLAHCAHCLAELEWERRLQALHGRHAGAADEADEVGQASAADAFTPGADTADRWPELRERIEARWSTHAVRDPLALIRRWWQKFRARRRPSDVDARMPGGRRGGAAAPAGVSVGVLVGLPVLIGALVLLGLWIHAAQNPTLAYRTLSSPEATAAADAIVMFDPNTTEQEMRAALVGAGAGIVGGPTDAGAWLLRLPETGRVLALQQLRAQPSVRLAEPLAQDEAAPPSTP